ncbi:MAG: GDP-mannose 4,6-dehydratase [Chlamydiota bacterium]|nr:GDP-mannose 4,6-dehydratase [Chlamydiota bacterium]
MKVLITGGAGFIGSHLAEKLLDAGHHVYIIDDLSTGSIDNVEHLKSNPSFHYTIDSIMDYSLVREMVDRVDIIFHLAAAVGVRLIVEDPVRTIVTNIRGTEMILDAAMQKKKMVVLASTSEVYGKGIKDVFSETDDLILGPTTCSRWSYACSKAIDEFLALAFSRQKGMPIIIARFFNTVGPRQSGQYGMVIPRFVHQALQNKPITVYGDGSQIRTFCHVHDVVNALIALMNCEKAVGGIFNIGSSQAISIKDLATLVRDLTKSTSNINYVPFEEAYAAGFEDIQRRIPDISKLKKMIGFSPKYSIKEILLSVIEYMKERLV